MSLSEKTKLVMFATNAWCMVFIHFKSSPIVKFSVTSSAFMSSTKTSGLKPRKMFAILTNNYLRPSIPFCYTKIRGRYSITGSNYPFCEITPSKASEFWHWRLLQKQRLLSEVYCLFLWSGDKASHLR